MSFSKIFTTSTTYVMPVAVSDLRIFMIGGGASGFSSHSGAGGAGYILTVAHGQISSGTTISITIGAGGQRTGNSGNSGPAYNGGNTLVTIGNTTYNAAGGTNSGSNVNMPGGNGSSGGGGAGNGGTAGKGGSGGSNGDSGSTYGGGTGMGVAAFNSAVIPTGAFSAGAGGAAGNSSHSGGGGAGGVITDIIAYPTAENGGSSVSGKGGVGFGAGGGSGGYDGTYYYYGGAGAPGMVYIYFYGSACYTAMPSGPRTLLNYITSFGITGSSSNNDSTNWRTGHATLTTTPISTYNTYFSRNTRVKIIQGDGSVDGPDWVVFNFDVDNGSGDFHGNHLNYSYFGGESTSGSNSNGGSGGLSNNTHGGIWGWANNKWNKLFQMELPGNNGLFSNSFAGWWASGNTVTSGNGKYADYDTLAISYIGFSVHPDSSVIIGPDSKIISTLTASQSTFYQKFVSGGTVSFDVISSNAGSVSRTHESNDTAVVTIPSSASPSASIAGPGKTTIKVTQPATGNYTQVINNELITIIVVGQGKTYTSETFPASFDLAGTNLTGSVFNSCNLTGADLYNTTVNASTSFSTSTLNSLKSGRITGVTSLLPAGYIMI